MERRLHIGGIQPVPGWEIFNAVPGPHVDHEGDAVDLSRFPDDTFAALYASHVLEHFDYRDALLEVLREWWRVLQPGGRIYISVPNMDVLAQLLLAKQQVGIQDRFMVMRMIFGGHVDSHDYHYMGFDQDILVDFMVAAGFTSFQRIDDFGFFEDTSKLVFHGQPISLNVSAAKPPSPVAPGNVPDGAAAQR